MENLNYYLKKLKISKYGINNPRGRKELIMKKPKENSSILELANGAILERADYELQRIIDNIRDPNTRPDKKRSLVLTIDFLPNFERDNIRLNVTAKSKLEATNPIATQMYITENDNEELIAVELTQNIPGQTNVFGDIQEEPKFILLKGGA